MRQPKVHYILEFYLKRCSQNNPDQKLFSGRYFPDSNRIKWTPHAPSGTGYERDLYGEIEKTFFMPLDNNASNILCRFESESTIPINLNLGEEDHNRWAEFILGLIVRRPYNVESIQNYFKTASWDKSIARQQIPNIIRNERAIKDLRSLTWVFARVNSNLELITCDNPVIFKPNNLVHPDCVIVLSMSPVHFFIATNKENIRSLETDPRKIAAHVNTEVIRNAHKRIYARSRHSVEDRFVIKHWRTKEDT